MDRFKQIDASNSSVGALLYHDEEVISLQDGIGLYDGKEKSLNQSNGTVYLTSHRLLYVDDLQPHRHSCSLELSLVKQSEYYAGFLKSSPKITLTLAPLDDDDDDEESSSPTATSSVLDGTSRTDRQPRDWRVSASAAESSVPTNSDANWICAICGFSNGGTTAQCELCGVTKEPTKSTSSRPSTSSGAVGKDALLTSQAEALSISPPKSSNPKEGIACSVCTFLNHPSMSKCEMCGSSLGRHAISQSSASAPMTPLRKSSDTDANSIASGAPTRSSTPGPSSTIQTNSVKLSFRKGGDKSFYSLLKSTLRAKAWSATSSSNGFGTTTTAQDSSSRNLARPSANTIDLDGRRAAVKRVGIDGIMSSVDTAARMQSNDMQGALKDLEALMTKAKQMVDFAEALNAKLTRQEQAAAAARASGAEEAPPQPDQEAATLIRSSLVKLGLPAPAVTADMARDQEEYHRELARELAGLLLGSSKARGLMGTGRIAAKGKEREVLPSMKEDGRGLIGLDEVWCVWNRARGVALIAPQALRTAAVFLPDMTSPSIRMKTFRSGLSVLHTPRYSDDAFAARILHFLDTLEWEHKMKRIEEGQRQKGGHLPTATQPVELFYGENLSVWGSGASILEIAEKEDVPILLINEMMEMIESTTGMVVRDEGGSNGTRWFVNHFVR